MKSKFIITFAGVPGSSKSPIINHLSSTFNLPVFSNDQLRHEVNEDLMVSDINIPKALREFEFRRKKMQDEILSFDRSVIFDKSVDRRWSELKESLFKYGYDCFLISLDFSVEFMTKLYTSTGRLWAVEELPAYNKQHQEFLAKYSGDVSLRLQDKDFINRVKICEEALKQFMSAVS